MTIALFVGLTALLLLTAADAVADGRFARLTPTGALVIAGLLATLLGATLAGLLLVGGGGVYGWLLLRAERRGAANAADDSDDLDERDDSALSERGPLLPAALAGALALVLAFAIYRWSLAAGVASDAPRAVSGIVEVASSLAREYVLASGLLLTLVLGVAMLLSGTAKLATALAADEPIAAGEPIAASEPSRGGADTTAETGREVDEPGDDDARFSK